MNVDEAGRASGSRASSRDCDILGGLCQTPATRDLADGGGREQSWSMESDSPFDGRAYQARIDAIANSGMDMHGEATLVRSFLPASVLDAGCGTGRVAIELARHGIEVLGVDIDASMINEARRLAPGLSWIQEDLAELSLGRQFDVVVLAGNVALFCPEHSRAALMQSCAAHVAPGGVLIAGFQLNRGYHLEDFDGALAGSDFVTIHRWSTWDREPFRAESDYAVSVLRRVRADD